MDILDNVLNLREFEEQGENYRVFDLAVPVIVYECSANQQADSDVDDLSRAVLNFLKYGIYSETEIAALLAISPDIVHYIHSERLFEFGFVDENGRITDLGKRYLQDDLEDEFRDTRVYGNMFINAVDGDVMPYFFEGKLPPATSLNNSKEFYIISSEKLVSDPFLDNRIFTKAYKKYARICKYSKSIQEYDSVDSIESEFSFLSSNYEDVLYTEMGTTDSQQEPVSMAAAEENTRNEETFVKVFSATKKIQYIHTQLIVEKNNPNDYRILSPFNNNVTNWYTKKIPFMEYEGNDVLIQISNVDEQIPFGQFLMSITDSILKDFPELQNADFSWYRKANYPLLGRLTEHKKAISTVLNRYYNSVLLNDAGKNSANEVLTTMAFALETILNCFIERISIKSLSYNAILVPYEKASYDKIFAKYGVENSIARTVSETVARKLKGWAKYGLNDGSISRRYCILILDGYVRGSGVSPFIQIIERYGTVFTDKLDFIIQKRNEFSSHNRNAYVQDISDNDYSKAKEYFTFVVQKMIETLYASQEEK